VPGFGHDQLERDLLVAEVGRRGVAELVQSQAVATSPNARISQPDTAGETTPLSDESHMRDVRKLRLINLVRESVPVMGWAKRSA